MVARYFLKLSYNGRKYHGWQIQPNAHSVQEELTQRLSILLKEKIDIVGCGRTDAGVHAKEFYAHFDTLSEIKDLTKCCYQLNCMLPHDIALEKIFRVNNDAHARFDATYRAYQYLMVTTKDPFKQDSHYFVKDNLNIDSMNLACQRLLGTQDFTSFSKLHTDVNNNFCTINHALWKHDGNEIVFTIEANRFLRNMVRSIVGTMIDIGKSKISPDSIVDIIQSQNRAEAGTSVAAQGLYLTHVEYNFESILNVNL